jgi:hypothetical protein
VLPPSVSEVGQTYGNMVERINADALSLLDQALRRGRKSPEAWRDAVQSIGNRLLTLQVLTASLADPYLNDILEAQGADAVAETQVVPRAFADLTDGGGSWLQGLVYAPNSVRQSGTGAESWTRFQFVAQSIVKTGISDTARGSVQAGMHARPAVAYYVRMLRGVSCARCIILAGKRSKRSVAFKRHKRCDCVNIPAAESSRDWSVSPKAAFKSLSAVDQDRLFGSAGAEAIRLGADPAQVVNADSGVYVARAHGQDLLATTTGTTARGLAGRRLGANTPRLMPEEIFLQAQKLGWDRTEVLGQLQRFGYLL